MVPKLKSMLYKFLYITEVNQISSNPVTSFKRTDDASSYTLNLGAQQNLLQKIPQSIFGHGLFILHLRIYSLINKYEHFARQMHSGREKIIII